MRAGDDVIRAPLISSNSRCKFNVNVNVDLCISTSADAEVRSNELTAIKIIAPQTLAGIGWGTRMWGSWGGDI